jgi:hypothetical protein
MKNNHCPEHNTFPARKMIGREVLKKKRSVYVYHGGGVAAAGKVSDLTTNQRKVLKKNHRKRSRRYLKENLE